jgi:hypothetical protein
MGGTPDQSGALAQTSQHLMAECDPGRRPPEWWDYEKKMPRPDEREAEALFGMGELRDAELAKLMPIWREQYEHAQKPGFAYCIGHAKPTDTFVTWIEGVEAREAYYDCAEIPRSLIKKWDVERDRDKEVIMKVDQPNLIKGSGHD